MSLNVKATLAAIAMTLATFGIGFGSSGMLNHAPWGTWLAGGSTFLFLVLFVVILFINTEIIVAERKAKEEKQKR